MACVVITILLLSGISLLSGIAEQNTLLNEYEFQIANLYTEKEKCRQQLGIFYHEPLSNKNKSKVQGKTTRKTVALD